MPVEPPAPNVVAGAAAESDSGAAGSPNVSQKVGQGQCAGGAPGFTAFYVFFYFFTPMVSFSRLFDPWAVLRAFPDSSPLTPPPA